MRNITFTIFAAIFKMITETIKHRGLKAYFFEGKPLPTSLSGCGEKLCYWLPILHAATSIEDLQFNGTQLKKSNPGYKYQVTGLGEFSFSLKDGNVENLDFKRA
jgi:hypothetical protein